MTVDEVISLKAQAIAACEAASTLDEVEAVRIAWLGRKGRLPEIMQAFKNVPNEQKKDFGQAVNGLKTELLELVNARKASFEDAGPVAAFDITQPGHWTRRGAHHPIWSIIDRAVDIFARLGFTVVDGPDIETVEHNFDALNTPANHPSRNPEDTYYLDTGELLRTHTSPVQIRHMKSHQPPIRILAPGGAYRRDTEDATHTLAFHQIEGLYVAENVSLADLKGDLTYFAQQILDANTEVRFRPHFFPFTEPSLEVDFSFEGKWIEIAGAGMVDPAVLEAVGYDPDKVTGYAFGMGVERIAAITRKMADIRPLYLNDMRFLSQFA